MKHIHILGICGTFMGGVAALAKEAGFRVTGCDLGVYPPMSLQLEALGVELIEGYDIAQLSLKPDLFVIGNVISRGNPLMEEILNRGLPYTSGPQWLADNILVGKHVLAIAGTHGKTTTTAMLAWILEDTGFEPGFLIGGVPGNFDLSSRLTKSEFFVIEADEYDTAFFDKRSKFVHYRPKTVILNNLEFDHADIFPDLEAIETQFHYMIRTVPSQGRLIVNDDQPALDRVLCRGCWCDVQRFGPDACWQLREEKDDSILTIITPEEEQYSINWSMIGQHNRDNALAAIVAAYHIGISPPDALNALRNFQGVKRRLEIRGQANQITLYDDFAHHPTAIATTLEGLRRRVGEAGRIIVLFEPRSNTMKLGVLRSMLPPSFNEADAVFCYAQGLGWDIASMFEHVEKPAKAYENLDNLIDDVLTFVKPHDHIVMMSNGGFGGLGEKLLAGLTQKQARVY